MYVCNLHLNILNIFFVLPPHPPLPVFSQDKKKEKVEFNSILGELRALRDDPNHHAGHYTAMHNALFNAIFNIFLIMGIVNTHAY